MIIDRPGIPIEVLTQQAAISAITLGGLALGVHAVSGSSPAAILERANRTRILQQVENESDPIPSGAEAARVFGALSAAVLAIGRKPRGRGNDLMIAAIAAAEGVPLYTTNPRDFAGLGSLMQIVSVVHS